MKHIRDSKFYYIKQLALHGFTKCQLTSVELFLHKDKELPVTSMSTLQEMDSFQMLQSLGVEK